MKKILITLLSLIMLSCTENETKGEFNEDILGKITFSEIDSKNMRISQNETDYNIEQTLLFEIENLNCNFTSSKVSTTEINEEIFLTTFIDKSTQEIITNALVKTTTTDNGTIIQLIDFNTNEVIHEEIIIPDSDYEQVVLGGNIICFKTFSSCYRTLTTAAVTDFDDVLQSTIPFFNAGIWLLCRVNGRIIQESSMYQGDQRCSKII
jgi:hypothetical protein